MHNHCGLLLLFLSCARTTENIYGDEFARRSDLNRFSLWPSVHNAVNAATLLRKRRATLPGTGANDVAGPNEATNSVATKQPANFVPELTSTLPSLPAQAKTAVDANKVPKEIKLGTSDIKEITTPGTTTVNTTAIPLEITTPLIVSTEKPKALDLNSPGVVKRGLIVFGGFALMAGAYLLFYKRKNQNSDMNSSLGINDGNQFRYGMLQNEVTKDNLESSRIPLTMESEDEIDEDLEIFDLMQKKKSLSYVNLQQNDEDVVLSARDMDIEGDNLLLDIEDASTDTLINWSNNGSKSIL